MQRIVTNLVVVLGMKLLASIPAQSALMAAELNVPEVSAFEIHTDTFQLIRPEERRNLPPVH